MSSGLLITGLFACIENVNFKKADISDIHLDAVQNGTAVRINEVQLTSPVMEHGFYISGPDGGPNNSLWVEVNPSISEEQELQIGEIVNLKGYVQNEVPYWASESSADPIRQIVIDEIDNIEAWNEKRIVLPNLIDKDLLETPEALKEYESALLRIENLRVTNPDIGEGSWEVADSLIVGNLFHDSPSFVGENKLRALQGILTFADGQEKLIPRGPNDLIGLRQSCLAERCLWDLEEGELLITEIMADPDDAGRCSDYDGEYVEISYQPRVENKGSVDLNGLIFGDLRDEFYLSKSVVLESGDHLWMSTGGNSCYGEPDLYMGTGIRLNTEGDSLILEVMTPEGKRWALDEVNYDADMVKPGTAVQLNPNAYNTKLNDSMENWCQESSEIHMTQDFGSPGQKNSSCD